MSYDCSFRGTTLAFTSGMNRALGVLAALLVFVSALVSLPDSSDENSGRPTPVTSPETGTHGLRAIAARAKAEAVGGGDAARAVLVSEFGPVGEVTDLAQARVIHVTFDRPMTPVTLPTTDARVGARLSPRVAGRWQWTGSRTLTFTANRSLPTATGFRVEIPAGVQSLDGSRLRETFAFDFETPRPRIVSSSAREDASDMGAREEISLTFNQDVSPANVERAIRILADGKRMTVRARHPRRVEQSSWGDERSAQSTILLRPERRWPANARIDLMLTAGARITNGTLGLRDTFTWSGRTYGTLTLLNTAAPASSHPYDHIRLRFSSRVRRVDLIRNLRLEPTVLLPTVIRGDKFASRELYLWVSLKPGETYTLTLNPRLKSIHGRALGGRKSLTFRTSDLPPALSMITGHVVMPITARHAIVAHLTNVETMSIRASRVSPNALLDLEEHGWSVDIETRPLAPRNARRDIEIPVRTVLPSGPGLVRIEVASSAERGRRILAVQFTDLGVTAKFAPDGIHAWVTSLSKTTPVVGAEVSIVAPLRGVVWTGFTNTEGVAAGPGWNTWAPGLIGDDWSTPKVFVIVRHGTDAAVTSSEWTEGVEAWRFPIEHKPGGEGAEWRGVIFTDRGLYRPGERVHLKGIGRVTAPEGFRSPLSDRTDGRNLVTVRVTGPEGEEIAVRTLPLAANGAFDLDLDIPRLAATGSYAAVATPGETTSRGYQAWWSAGVSGTFRVSEFRPTRIQASVSITGSRLNFASSTSLRVKGTSLSGAALAERAVRVTAMLDAEPPAPKGWEQFSFSPAGGSYDECDDGGDATVSRMLMDRTTKLGSDGVLTLRLRVPAPNSSASALTDGRLSMEATITDVTNQSVSARTSRRVEAAGVVIGVRATEGLVDAGGRTTMEAVLLDRHDRAVEGRAFQYELLRRTWRSRRVRVSGGSQWISRPVDVRVATGACTSGLLPVRWTIKPQDAGYHIVRVTASDSSGRRISAATGFYACGADASWWRGNDDRVDLIPDRVSYAPGSTARVLVRSPFKRARAWVTLEREGIAWSRMMTLEGAAPVIEVPLPAALIPNACLGVVLIDADALREDGSGVRIGLLNLAIEPAGRRLACAIEPLRPEYQPGETASVRIKVCDAEGRPIEGEVTVAVVDEGVVALTAHRFPDPIESLHAPRPHRVTTADLRTRVIMGRTLGEKGEEMAGDGADESEHSQSAREARRDFNPCALWAATIRTDARGEAVVSFRLPDAITTWRVLAMAVATGDRYGRGDAAFLARKEISLEPSLPRILRPGDEAEVVVLARNFLGRSFNLTSDCAIRGASIVGAGMRAFDLEANGEKRLSWLIRVPATTRETSVVFLFSVRASSSGRPRDAVEVTVPVIHPVRTITAATSGSIEGGSLEEAVRLSSRTLPGTGELVITLASTGLTGLSGAADYLFEYPYGCLEQRTSRVVPILEFGEIATELGLNGLPDGRANARKIVEEWLVSLPEYQARDGGYALWKGAENGYPYLTAVVVKGTARARKRGYAVNEQSLDAAAAWLQRMLNDAARRAETPYGRRTWAATDAAIAEALAEAGRLKPGDLEIPARARADMPLVGLAALFRAAVLVGADGALKCDLRNRITNALRVAPTTAHFEEVDPGGLEWIYHSDVTATAAALEAVLEDSSPFHEAEKVVKWLTLERRNGRWQSTRENSAVFGAFSAFFRSYESATPDFAARVLVEGLVTGTASFNGRDAHPRVLKMPLGDGARRDADLPIRFEREGEGRLYFELRLVAASLREDAFDAGFSITRRIETLDGRSADQRRLSPGQLYRLRITVTTLQTRLFVACDLPLPSGLEGVDDALATESRVRGETWGTSGSGWWNGFRRFEIRDDRLLWFADSLDAGRHELTAVVRATASGSFDWPGARCEAMYEPEVAGRSAGTLIVVGGRGR